MLNLLKLGYTTRLAGFTNLNKEIPNSDLESTLRKASLIQLISRYGGISIENLEKMNNESLLKMYQNKEYKRKLTENIKNLDCQLPVNKRFLFISSPYNFIIRKKDNIPLRKLNIHELETELKNFENKLKDHSISIKLPSLSSIYREQAEKKITSVKLKELCNEKGILPPKTKKELLQICLNDQDIKKFIISQQEGDSLEPRIEDLERYAIEDKLVSMIVKYAFNDDPKYKKIRNLFVAVPIGKYIMVSNLKLLDSLEVSELQDILSQQQKILGFEKSVKLVTNELPSTSTLIKSVFTMKKIV